MCYTKAEPLSRAIRHKTPATQMASSEVKRKQRVSFGDVVIHSFAVGLDGTKLPTTGCAPIGLGEHMGSSSAEALDSFEIRVRRGIAGAPRRSAAELLLGHGQRMEMLTNVDPEELAAVEEENRNILGATTAILLQYRAMMDEEEDETRAPDGSSLPLPEDVASAKQAATAVSYSTALAGEKRSGHGGGFSEVDSGEEELRKRSANANHMAI